MQLGLIHKASLTCLSGKDSEQILEAKHVGAWSPELEPRPGQFSVLP